MPETKKCLQCGEKLIGRVDKKFCCDQCRNAFNNLSKTDDNGYIREVNHILRKNRRILEEMNPEGKGKTHRDKLLAKGFVFSFFTNTYITKEGKTYYFCYDQGYLPLDNNFYFLVKREQGK